MKYFDIVFGIAVDRSEYPSHDLETRNCRVLFITTDEDTHK